jgi:8-oxo-dGTP pyrophosphatase MutT (NUDIX family)
MYIARGAMLQSQPTVRQFLAFRCEQAITALSSQRRRATRPAVGSIGEAGLGGMMQVETDDLAARLAGRLDPLDALAETVTRSDFDLGPGAGPEEQTSLKPAAVLAPIVRRPGGWTLLLTERTHDMPSHPGQISFPGGRLQASDSGPLAAALREAEEELGVSRTLFHPVGGFDAYETGTGYRITPIVAYLDPGFLLKPDPREVADVFETPLAFLMNPANHERREGEWRGARRFYYAMPYAGRFIWGATAGMIRALYERLYG